jgi:riboflavin synthase
MFTGLIEKIGNVRMKTPKGKAVSLEIASGNTAFFVELGDSVAVEGACLTVTKILSDGFHADVSTESLLRTTLKNIGAGSKVNLERAMRLGDRLGGHLVSGHIDAVGNISEIKPEGDFTKITIKAPPDIMALVVEKGSIAVNGISLTVNGVFSDRFWMMIIPETLSLTTLSEKKAGDQVNLETDIIGKYVAKLMGKEIGQNNDKEFLKKLMEEGFL